MVSAMNPCPCGYFSDPKKDCTCSSSAVSRYHKRVSRPLLDRINVFVEVPPVEYEKPVDEAPAHDSSYARQRVEQACEIQRDRFKDDGFLCNSETGPAEVCKSCPLDESAKSLLQSATQRLNLSSRAFHRILKVSRTIADLAPPETSASPTWPRRYSTGRGDLWGRGSGNT
jgi:magnesium chelatase family protein